MLRSAWKSKTIAKQDNTHDDTASKLSLPPETPRVQATAASSGLTSASSVAKLSVATMGLADYQVMQLRNRTQLHIVLTEVAREEQRTANLLAKFKQVVPSLQALKKQVAALQKQLHEQLVTTTADGDGHTSTEVAALCSILPLEVKCEEGRAAQLLSEVHEMQSQQQLATQAADTRAAMAEGAVAEAHARAREVEAKLRDHEAKRQDVEAEAAGGKAIAAAVAVGALTKAVAETHTQTQAEAPQKRALTEAKEKAAAVAKREAQAQLKMVVARARAEVEEKMEVLQIEQTVTDEVLHRLRAEEAATTARRGACKARRAPSDKAERVGATQKEPARIFEKATEPARRHEAEEAVAREAVAHEAAAREGAERLAAVGTARVAALAVLLDRMQHARSTLSSVPRGVSSVLPETDDGGAQGGELLTVAAAAGASAERCRQAELDCVLHSLRQADADLHAAHAALLRAHPAPCASRRLHEHEELQAELVQAKLRMVQLQMERNEHMLSIRKLQATNRVLRGSGKELLAFASPSRQPLGVSLPSGEYRQWAMGTHEISSTTP